MADWSMGNLKDTFGNFTSNPNQALSNPWFGMGMGLLQSSYDGNVNPYAAAMGGLAQAKGVKEADEDRERIQKLRDELATLIQKQQELQMQREAGVNSQNPVAFPGAQSPLVGQQPNSFFPGILN